MYYDFLFKAFNMSVTASWLILAVLLLRFVFKKAPKWLRVALWGVVGLRLLLPFLCRAGSVSCRVRIRFTIPCVQVL